MILAITGHRPSKLPGGYDESSPGRIALREKLESEVLRINPHTLISGMALGVDTIAAEIALAHYIALVCAVPFCGQELRWNQESQKRFLRILSNAHQIEYVCDPGYAAWKMQKRNEWMVDHCTELLAVWDGSAGGTGNCVTYAKKKGVKINRIDPREIR